MQGEKIRNENNQKEKMLYSNGDLKKLIIPLIIEQTLAIAVGMADTIMVSAAGEAAVSALALQVFWLAVLVLLGKLLMRRAEKKITVQGG